MFDGDEETAMIKTLLLPLAAVTALMTVAAPAQAAPHGVARAAAWTPIDRRQAELERRIDVGERRHALTRVEAAHLRQDFRRIVRLEARYRQNGLSRWEMADLDRRMDELTRQIRVERHDDQRRR